MGWQLTPIALIYILIAVLGLIVARMAWRWRATPGAPALAALLIATAIWALADGFERMAPALGDKIQLAKFAHLGIQSVGVIFLVFAARYTNQAAWLTPRRHALLWMFPFITLVLVATNEWHGLIWPDVYMVNAPAGPDSVYDHGAWFWLATAYTYTLLTAGAILLLRAIARHRDLYRKQAFSLLVALVLPLIANFVYLSDKNPMPGLDWTSISFVFSSMLIAWAISSLRLLELPPMARNMIFDRLNDGIIVLDPKNRVIDANPAGQRLLGGDGACIGLPLDSVLPMQPALRRLFEAPSEAHGLIAFEGEPIRAYDTQSTPLTDRRGRLTGRVLVMRDISERLRLEESLRRATRAAEAGTIAQKEFLAMMGHELRTPLTGILGMAEALQWGIQGPLTESQMHSLEVIESSGRQLNDRITDMLDYASLEAGTLTLTVEACSAKAICESCVRSLESQTSAKQQSVTFTVVPANLVVQADARRLRQMVNKLLDNASKFTPEGGTLGIDVQQCAGGNSVSIAVWDTGIGIAAEDQGRLFKPFVQLDSGLKRRYGGSGMSLAIVSALATRHGGGVNVESTPGAGSRFTIELPCA